MVEAASTKATAKHLSARPGQHHGPNPPLLICCMSGCQAMTLAFRDAMPLSAWQALDKHCSEQALHPQMC